MVVGVSGWWAAYRGEWVGYRGWVAWRGEWVVGCMVVGGKEGS